MDLTKRLGISDDILKAATEVLEGKKITHPNQKEISTAAPPHDEITGADFKALKAKKKMHRVEGFDRNKKRYESPLFETYEEALAFYNKIRKSAPLTNLEITEIDEAEQIDELERSTMANYVDKADKDRIKRQRETPVDKRDAKFYGKNDSRLAGINRAVDKLNKEEAELSTEAKELNTANANDARAHDCAKHVVHEQWGVGETVPTMHAEPDADGKIAWYDVMFEHGIEHQVPTTALEITLSETHVHKKSKRMTEAEEHGKKKASKKGESQVIFNPEQGENGKKIKEEVETVDEMSKSMAYATGTKRAMQAAGDEPPLEKSTIKKAHKIAKAILRKEETETLDEGRKAGVVGSVLSNPAAREHFKKLTGKEPSYFHISKNPEHAQAALNHAAKAKAPEGEKPADAGDEDTEANKHPINQLRGIADRGGGRFMGKDITRAHATKLISMHDDLKPAQKLDFVSNIGKHLSKVMS